MKTIKNWKIVVINGDQCVTGLIYNHPGFKDGSNITTSTLKGFDHGTSGELLLTTIKGSIYLLIDQIIQDRKEEYKNPDIKPDHYSSVEYLVKNGFLKDHEDSQDDGDL